MIPIRRSLALFSLASATSLFGQPTVERTACAYRPNAGAYEATNLELAAVDLDDDGRDDLAMGLDFYSRPDTAEFRHGLFTSFVDSGGPLFDARPFPIFGAAESFFGRTLAAGDFNNDGVSEVAIGSPGDGGGRVLVLGCDKVLGCYVPVGIALVQGQGGIGGTWRRTISLAARSRWATSTTTTTTTSRSACRGRPGAPAIFTRAPCTCSTAPRTDSTAPAMR